MSKNTMTFTDNRNGKTVEFPILNPTIGPDVIDISSLYKEMGMFTYDLGFTSTANCQSEITYIDGDKGELLHRGYNIQDLVEKEKSFLEISYLLLNGELPNAEEFATMDKQVRSHYMTHEGIKKVFNAFPDNAHPMAMLSSAASLLSTYHFQHLNLSNKEDFLDMSYKILAKIPVLAAYAYRHLKGLPLIYPDTNKSFTENFLYMMRADAYGRADIKDIEVRILDTIFSLHADHEQNASTATVRSVASTGAHPYAAISAGINALWGSAHGGANEAVIKQLEEIGTVDRVEEFIAKAKDKNDPFRLMGFGHRVYKNFDPRSKALKKLRDEFVNTIPINNEILKVGDKVAQMALSDEYFTSRKLYPNVDFYSGTILTALGIPKNMFTVIFVIGRTIGWISQLIELKNDKTTKIVRPRQLYTGKAERKI
jgi:citrate synthase